MHYTVKAYNDMGHLEVRAPDYSRLPRHIENYARQQAVRYLIIEYTNRGTAHYHLHPGFNEQHRYHYGDDTIDITWPRLVSWATL